VVRWERAETAHTFCGSLHVALLDVVTGGLREDEHTTSQDGSPDELNGQWDTVGTGIIPGVGSLVGASCEEKTNGDSQLVTTDDRSSNPLWR